MNRLARIYRIFFLGLLFAFFLFGVFPVEIVVVTFLFLAISYGGIVLIRIATHYDGKMKKVDKT
ncbi:hypothetical protein [Methylomonas sp. MgM2]